LIIIFVVVLKISFIVNQEQLTAFATTSGVFAGLALAVAPLISQSSPSDYGRRSFLLLALTFVLTTILLLAAKIEIGESSAVTLYFLSIVVLSAVAVATPTLRSRIRKYEFYVEIILVLIPLTPSFDLLTASLIMFIFGGLQLIGLLFFVSSATFIQSEDGIRYVLREEIKNLIQGLLEENIAKALSFDEIIQDLAGRGHSISMDSLRMILEEMNHGTLSSRPRLTIVHYDHFVPRWKESYMKKLDKSLPIIIMVSTWGSGSECDNELNEGVAQSSGLSPELISQYVNIDWIKQQYFVLEGRKYILIKAFDELRERFEEIPDSKIVDQNDLEGMLSNFDDSTSHLDLLKNDNDVIKVIFSQEESALSRLESGSKSYFVSALFKLKEGSSVSTCST